MGGDESMKKMVMRMTRMKNMVKAKIKLRISSRGWSLLEKCRDSD